MGSLIELTYIENGKTYKGTINREAFFALMIDTSDFYPDRNANAKKLCELIPEFQSIKINKDIIETQDVPFIEYTTFENSVSNMLRLSRPCRIIWSIFEDYCDQAKAGK